MKNDNSSRLLFMETCITVVFLMMIAITCFLCFTKAKILQMDANSKIKYSNIAGDAAEIFLASNDENDAQTKFQDEYDSVDIADNLITCAYDKDTIVAIDIEPNDNMMNAYITVYSNNKPMIQLSLKKVIGEVDG